MINNAGMGEHSSTIDNTIGVPDDRKVIPTFQPNVGVPDDRKGHPYISLDIGIPFADLTPTDRSISSSANDRRISPHCHPSLRSGSRSLGRDASLHSA